MHHSQDLFTHGAGHADSGSDSDESVIVSKTGGVRGGDKHYRCHIIGAYLQKHYPDFYEAIVNLCAENSLWYGFSNPGLTFIIPTDKVRKSIIDNVESNASTAVITFKSYIFMAPIPNAKSFTGSNLKDSRGNDHTAKVTGNEVVLDGSLKVVPVKHAFNPPEQHKDKLFIWMAESGELTVPTSHGKHREQTSGGTHHMMAPTIHGGKFVLRREVSNLVGGHKSPYQPEDARLDVLRRVKLVNMLLDECKGDMKALVAKSVSLFNYLQSNHNTTYNTMMSLVNMNYPVESMLAAIVSPLLTYETLFGNPSHSNSSTNVGWQGLDTLDNDVTVRDQWRAHYDANVAANHSPGVEPGTSIGDGIEVYNTILSQYNSVTDVNKDNKKAIDMAMFLFHQGLQHMQKKANAGKPHHYERIVATATSLALTPEFDDMGIIHKIKHVPNPIDAVKTLHAFATSDFILSRPADSHRDEISHLLEVSGGRHVTHHQYKSNKVYTDSIAFTNEKGHARRDSRRSRKDGPGGSTIDRPGATINSVPIDDEGDDWGSGITLSGGNRHRDASRFFI